jgi:hypothetical protein
MKRFLTGWIVILVAAGAWSQEKKDAPPPPPPADNGPNLEVTMKFIQDRITQQGTLNFAVYSHDSTDNSDSVNQVSKELTGLTANPDSCRILYQERTGKDDKLLGISAFRVDVKVLQDVLVMNLEQAIDQNNAEAGHPARISRVNPSSWIVRARRKPNPVQSHEDVRQYTKQGNGLSVAVTRSDDGDKYRFQVDSAAPSLENRSLPFQSFDSISVYASQTTITGINFPSEGTLPMVRGRWKPGDHVHLQFDLAKQFAHSAHGWSLYFCIGGQGGCIPSPNLLEDAEPDSYDFYFHDEDTANRVAKAVVHAIEQCGGGSQPEPF